MDITYNHKAIEDSAQKLWQKKQLFHVTEDLNKEKFYCLSMFPYPSGTLHMGHVRNYTIGDVISRYQRALGKNVLQPIGWDAFGLPAENAAIKHGTHPENWTFKNIESMKAQFSKLGNAYDWKRELATCEPEYYRWEQWFFIKLYEKGLVYKKNAIVNWDPVDQTVLANEQVIDGRGWRSGALVEHKEISQWFVKITQYADELLNGLDTLEQWPHKVKQMQKNWIGRSEGAEISFQVDNYPKPLKIYTTRADTLFGVTYLAVSPDHPLALKAAKEDKNVQSFLDDCQGISTAEADMATVEKKGVQTSFTAVHPITNQKLPIWVANFVLMQYGSGAVMSVPAHDERDYEFAKKYDLPIKAVIQDACHHDYTKSAYLEKGMLIHSDLFDGLESDDAIKKITDYLQEHGFGKAKVNYRLRDWGISRQRFWGAPIPMIYCDECGVVPEAEENLPVELPKAVNINTPGSPLSDCAEFIHTSCPRCGQDANRETDTFDTFFESSWYYARFACKGQSNAMLDDRAKYWTPVDQYIGGIEHACMHLLYARFFHKLMRDEGLVNSDEPFISLLCQGMVLKDGQKMSKSVGNIVDPNHIIEQYGADTARLFTMFASPPEQSLEWSDSGIEGAYRFLKRVWGVAYTNHVAIKDINTLMLSNGSNNHWMHECDDIKNSRRTIYQILTQINHDYEKQQFNTVVSGAMKIFNELSALSQDSTEYNYFIHEGFSILIRILAPITPHICHHLWQILGFDGYVIDAPWPQIDKSALKIEEVEFTVQVNGRVRGHFKASAKSENEQLIELAKNAVAPFIQNHSIKKSIVVSHRYLINLVVPTE